MSKIIGSTLKPNLVLSLSVQEELLNVCMRHGGLGGDYYKEECTRGRGHDQLRKGGATLKRQRAGSAWW